MIPLKQNTASQEIPLGPFVDDTDGDTEETGLTIANTDIKLWKNGATTLANKNSGGATHISDGIYYATLDATDTNTLGPMKGYVHIAGALYVWETFLVMTAEAYETFINTGIWNHLLASHDVANTFGEKINDIGSAADMSDAVWDEARSGHVAAGTFGENVLADIIEISGDSVAADNLELQYDTTGLTGDNFPARQDQLNNLAIGSSAISVIAALVDITTGTPTGTYTNTHERDGAYHEIADIAGTTDLYYEFDVGGNGIPVSISFVGYVNGINDSINVFGYNWNTTSWEQIGSLLGQTGTGDNEQTFSMYSSHVGTGVNIGKVRVRFANTGLTTSNLAIDQLYVSYAVVVQSVGYANGSIWIDTINGVSGTTPYVHGTADNPVDNLADAVTLSTTLGLVRFEFASGSSVTTIVNTTGFIGNGAAWTLTLAGHLVTNAVVTGANLSGTVDSTSTGAKAYYCNLNTCSLAPFSALYCSINATITLLAAGTYIFDSCYSGIAGIATPVIDFGSVGTKYLNLRHYSGGIEIYNMKAGDNMSLEGHGQIVLNANCTGGTIAIRGNFDLTDNAGGVITLSEDARFTVSETSDGIWAETLEGSLSSTEILRILLAAVAGITTDGGLKFRDIADAKNRIVAVTDASKNRTSITLDGSD